MSPAAGKAWRKRHVLDRVRVWGGGSFRIFFTHLTDDLYDLFSVRDLDLLGQEDS